MSESYLATHIIDLVGGGLKTYADLLSRVPRSATIASSAAPTPNCDTTDRYKITALAEAAVFGAPTGTPQDGQKILFWITDNGTARALSWAAMFKAQGVVLPTTTVLGKLLIVGAMYDATQAKWLVVATALE
jgi:hypothetical protein